MAGLEHTHGLVDEALSWQRRTDTQLIPNQHSDDPLERSLGQRFKQLLLRRDKSLGTRPTQRQLSPAEVALVNSVPGVPLKGCAVHNAIQAAVAPALSDSLPHRKAAIKAEPHEEASTAAETNASDTTGPESTDSKSKDSSSPTNREESSSRAPAKKRLRAESPAAEVLVYGSPEWYRYRYQQATLFGYSKLLQASPDFQAWVVQGSDARASNRRHTDIAIDLLSFGDSSDQEWAQQPVAQQRTGGEAVAGDLWFLLATVLEKTPRRSE